MRVWWVGGDLPPTVLVGQMVSAIGRIVTYDGGRDWRVSDALPLTATWESITGPLFDYLAEYAADPSGWCTPETIDRWAVKRPSFTK